MRWNVSGQALVEQALLLPLMVAVLLGLLQLALAQHAAIACDVAAFQAARAGVVYQADAAAMTRAARLALLPALGRTDGAARWAATRARVEAAAPGTAAGAYPQVSVQLLEPSPAPFDDPGLAGHLDGRQLDCDDRRPEAAVHTLLTVRVRFLYPLRIPLGDRLVQAAWLGAQRLSGGTTAADGIAAAAYWRRRGRLVLPLASTWTLRMQSNPTRDAARSPARG